MMKHTYPNYNSNYNYNYNATQSVFPLSAGEHPINPVILDWFYDSIFLDILITDSTDTRHDFFCVHSITPFCSREKRNCVSLLSIRSHL